MGAIAPVLSTLATAAGAVTTAKSAVETLSQAGRGWGDSRSADLRALKARQDLELSQLSERQRLGEAQAAEDAALESARIAADSAATEEARRAALRRAAAAQRAKFGAQGLSPQDGSSEAVLLGLFEESDADRARREEIDGLRAAALSGGLAQKRSVNLLQSAQLSQRHALERVLRGRA